MENYGAKIATLRAKKNMTQAQLGGMLNVTSQAVSKWENGLSEPDLETIKKICDIFEISVNDFFETKPKNAETAVTASQAQPKTETKVVYAYCEKCKKPLFSTEEYVVRRDGEIQHIFCKNCNAEITAQKHAQTKKNNRTEFLRGIKWATVAAAIALVLGIIAILNCPANDLPYAICGTIFITLGAFASVSQIIWCTFLCDVFMFFLRSLKFPGLIFTLDLDGIVWFICVKLLFAVIGFIFSAGVFIIGLFVTAAVGIVTFPFVLPKAIKDSKNEKERTF